MENSYKKLFASVYDPIMDRFEPSLFKIRKKLISDLSGTILDVGSGTGPNFRFFKPGTRIISVEPSESMLKIARKKVSKKQQIEFHACGITDPIMDSYIPDNSLDAIVCTLVLCSVADPNQALKNFSRWLKPEGKLVVLEHIHASKPINKKVLSSIDPLWRIFSEGCTLTRDTDKMIKAAGFKAQYEKYFVRALRFHSGIFVLNQP